MDRPKRTSTKLANEYVFMLSPNVKGYAENEPSGQRYLSGKRLINVPRFWRPYVAFLYQPLGMPVIGMNCWRAVHNGLVP